MGNNMVLFTCVVLVGWLFTIAVCRSLLKDKKDKLNGLETESKKLKDDYNNLLTEKNNMLNELTTELAKLKDDYNNLLTEKNIISNELTKSKKRSETLNKDFICYFLWDIYQNMFRSSTPRSMINYFKYHCDREYDIDFIDSEGVQYDINLHDIISCDDGNTDKKGKVACINVPGYKIGGKVVKTAQVTIYK